jgi:hypothetical protein
MQPNLGKKMNKQAGKKKEKRGISASTSLIKLNHIIAQATLKAKIGIMTAQKMMSMDTTITLITMTIA